ncbi:MAG: heparinase II/III family protein, partial [Burkholderiales bacterium]|nr:heparinase II/III family protein [Opitutaceae bacterium]
LVSARVFQGAIIDLATVARVEGDARYAARAREELLAVAALPDWGPHHFLDNAEYALGVSLGLDWLHDSLSPADRDKLETALMERCIKLTFDREHPSLWWLTASNNWAPVCHAGLTAAALAIADRDPALAARTIARAVEKQAAPNATYAPDGVYPEGPMYWGYGTSFAVILISLLDHALGTDYGLAAAPGFLASADYMTQVIGPSGRFFNYSDAREAVPALPVLHWFAARRGQPGIAASEVDRLAGSSPSTEGAERGIHRLNGLALWWRGTDIPVRGSDKSAAPNLPLNWLGRGETPVAVFRSAWQDPRATFVGLKGGSPASVHSHMDAGSFVLESDGVRWAVDPGMQDYTSLEAAGLTLWSGRQESDRWTIFRLGPEGHNILRFNAAPQLAKGSAHFTAFSADARGAAAPHAVLDLTPLYAAASVQRKVSLLPDRRVLLDDTWTAGPAPLTVTWQWLTRAEVKVNAADRSILLSQAGETLRLRVLSPGKVRIDTRDVSAPFRAFDEANPGLSRVRIHLDGAAGAPGRLVVIAEPGSVIASGDLPDPALDPAPDAAP